MKCSFCKTKEATITSEVFIHDEAIQSGICEDCYQKIQGGTNVEELAKIIGSLVQDSLEVVEEETDMACSTCGTTMELIKSNTFGCEKCYEYLDNSVEEVDYKDNTTDLDKLKAELSSAIEDENYEKAAIIRDQINDYD